MTLLLLLIGYPSAAAAPSAAEGQPAMVRTQQVTFQPGTYDRSPNAWSFACVRAWQMILSPRVTMLRSIYGD